jgi:hypothetical protein
VCGLHNPEDLVRLPGENWIVVGQINFDHQTFPPSDFRFAPLLAVKVDTREVRWLFPTSEGAVDWDRKTYPDCSAPPKFISPHGVNVRTLGKDRFRLYVVNHGGRQSIEIFDVAVYGDRLQTDWRGCLHVPKEFGIWENAVAPLPDGGVALSGFNVAIWHPGRGWTKFERFKGMSPTQTRAEITKDSSLANGVEVSRDGQWLFVADTLQGSVTRFPVEGDAASLVFKIEVFSPGSFAPDNLRWGEDGGLYVSGPYFSPSGHDLTDCTHRPVCDRAIGIARIDPVTLTVKNTFQSDGIKGKFGMATTALQIGDRFWLGTSFGDRIAIIKP